MIVRSVQLHTARTCYPLSVASCLALVALLAIWASPATEARTTKSVKVNLSLPKENNINVARLNVSTSSGKAFGSIPKVKLKNKSKLPDDLSVFTGVKKGDKRKRKTSIFVVIVKRKSSISVEAAKVSSIGAAITPTQDTLPVQVKGRSPIKVKGKSIENIGENNLSSNAICEAFLKTDPPLRRVAGGADANAVDGVVDRRCNNQPAFEVTLRDPSWTHHIPTYSETTVCATITTNPPQAGAEDHAFLGRETATGFPSIADGPGVLDGQGQQKVGFAIQQVGVYEIRVWVQNKSWFSVYSQSINISVPYPETNGPTPC